MDSEVPEGRFLDKEGRVQRDRRKGGDRRNKHAGRSDRAENMRRKERRQSGIKLAEREHELMIDEALENMGNENGGDQPE